MFCRQYPDRHALGPRVLATAVLLACAGLPIGCQPKETAPVESAAVPVTVSLPIEREVTDYEDFTGRTDAVETVDIRARVTGYLNKVCFQDGAEVKQGDLLFEIDPRPFQAKYDQAVAQIRLREADLKFRQAEFDRASQLISKNAVSRSDYDQALAQADQARAAVTAAQANTEAAKLDLDFTRLLAPIDGIISRARVTKGNLVNADQTLLTTLVSDDPMYVYFDVDEPTSLRIEQEVREGKIKMKTAGQIPVWMGLDNEEGYPHRGTLNFADNRVDPTTGTIQLRGVFPNPQPATGRRVLTPGLFARVRVPVGEAYKAILIPERALATDQGQKYVLVVGDKNEVEYRPVTLGRHEGPLRVIRKGLQPGQRVIVTGIQRVRPGMTVTPKLVETP